MKLYEYAKNFEELFDSLDAISDYEPETNAEGQYIDDDGNIIDDLDAYKNDMKQAWFDTLDGIEEAFEDKAENIACLIKQLKYDIEMLKKEKANIERRRKAKENQLESVQNYLMECMKKIKRTKIDVPKAKISIKNNAESAYIPDENEFVKICILKGLTKYLRYKDPEINKTAVKNDLKSNIQVMGAELKRTTSLIIK